MTPATMYVQSCSLKEALEGVEKGMKGSMADYKFVSITETPVMDVYKYEE